MPPNTTLSKKLRPVCWGLARGVEMRPLSLNPSLRPSPCNVSFGQDLQSKVYMDRKDLR